MRRTSARIAQLRQHLDRVKWRDVEAAQTYYTLVRAQPVTHYVLTDYDRMLKEYYSEEKIAFLTAMWNPFYGMLKKVGRELNRTVYCVPVENCPPDRAYLVGDRQVAVAYGLHHWLPKDTSVEWKRKYLGEFVEPEKEEPMPRIEERVVREFPQKIQTNPPNDAYREGWDRVFGEKRCTGEYDDGIADGNLTRCSNREGCGLPGCPALDFGVTP